MIPIPLSHIFVWYFAVWFFAIAFLWVRDEFRKRKNTSDSVVKDRLYLCGKCRLTFLARDNNREHFVRCPRCHDICFFRQSKRF